MTALLCSFLSLGYQIPLHSTSRPHMPALRTAAPLMADPWAASSGIDMNTVAGVAAGLLGVGGGVALIAFTENAGKANEQRANAQPCVECKGEKVVTCTICDGSGVDPLATLVQGVREATGEAKPANVVTVEDWDSGPKQVIMYEEILSAYPVKATENVCSNCDGRGVVVCDNCQGTGIQPRFLERFSPDDFMD
mmetsp:Transcript_41144/g.90328  ORF Transcript_41144/g.90328 Transcript_41144/m.90328 type:complete len:194 (+) Transcript_41144:107-688(+)